MKALKLIGLAFIVLLLGTVACKKDNDIDDDNNNNNPPPTDTTDNTTYATSFKLDNSPVYLEYDSNGYQLTGFVKRSPSTADSCLFTYAGGISRPIVGDPLQLILPDSSFFVQLPMWFRDLCIHENSRFVSLFNTGAINFSDNENSKGVNVIWVGYAGKVWQSVLGSQTGSNFTLNEVKDVSTQGLAALTVRLIGTLNCTLYDSTGDTMLLTDGNFVVTISDCSGLGC